MDASSDVLGHFAVLDELIQVVYQGFDRFVVLSTVAESAWTVHVGLKGPQGRWWRGSWSAHDITHFFDSRLNADALQSFACSLSEAFVNGELRVGNWAPDQGTKINLTVKPTAKKPAVIPLVELSPKEAVVHATTILCGIALQAQGRRCQLNPPAYSTWASGSSAVADAAAPSGARTRTRSSGDTSPGKAVRAGVPQVAVVTRTEGDSDAPVVAAARQRIEALEAELEHVKAAKARRAAVKSKSPSSEVEPKPSGPARRPKGASLANPHKKARKYEAVEFESDD